MTASRRPGRIAIIDDDDLFARGPDDELLHVHNEFDHGRSGSTEGRDLAGDPILIRGTDGQLHIFARGRGGLLLHWKLGPSGKVTGPFNHRWRIAYDPVAAALPGGDIELYARGANDELIRWRVPFTGDPGPAESLGGSVVATPAGVVRTGAVPDVFALAADGTVNWHGVIAKRNGTDIDFVGWRRIGDGATGAPVAVSWRSTRLDVLAPGADTDGPHLMHWGFDGTKGWHTEPAPGADPLDPSAERLLINGTWFGADTSNLGAVETLSCAVVLQPDHARVFARDAAGRLVQWHWDGVISPDTVGWFGPDTIADAVSSAPGALTGRPPWVYAWVGEGHSLFRFVQKDDGSWSADEMEVDWPLGQDEPPARQFEVDVDLVISRPADLLRIGIGWSGFTVADGDPPSLVPIPGETTQLRLVLPPQHIAEGFTGATESVPAQGQWESVQAGVSQLVLTVPAEPVPLTPAGVLGAARKGVVQADDLSTPDPDTFIELPWQLFVSPDGATLEHPVADPEPDDNGVSLWRTRLLSESGDLAILSAGVEDSFPVPLDALSRGALATQGRPAHADRLELSSLGGTLRAHGDWGGLEWQHEATLGRDGRVRIDVRGVLYPYGHRAVLTTITERDLTDPANPVGVLRQHSYLNVQAATISRPADDAELARAFPFDEVTITTRRFDNVSQGEPKVFNRPAFVPADIIARIAAAEGQLAAMPRVVDGWTGPVIPDEVAATFVGQFDSIQGDQRQLAESRILLIEQIQDLMELAQAVRELHQPSITQYFTPLAGDDWLQFPVTCRLAEQVLSFSTPMIFVTDQQLPETPTNPAFDTLVDGDVQAEVAKRWATMRRRTPLTLAAPAPGAQLARDDDGYPGMITLAGHALDLLGTGAEDDRQLVNRIYVSAQAAGRGFRPRLGPDTTLDQNVPQPPWAFDLTLPSLRTLLPGRTEAHRVVTTFSQAYLQTGAAAEIVHDIVGPATGIVNKDGDLANEAGAKLSEIKGLVVDFTKDAERAGGLAAPKMLTDGLSRLAGPVNVAGLTSLDPKTLLATGVDGAKLLGFSLTDLLGTLNRDELPTITTDLSGPQPVVSMLWPPNPPGTPPEQRRRQELTPASPFAMYKPDKPDEPVDPAHPDQPKPKPSMAMEVRAAGTDVRTECSVTWFSLAFPPKKPLLTLNFKQVKYIQEAGRPPALSIDGLDAEFSDELDILTALQEKIGLGDKGPTIRVVDDAIVAAYSLAIPDASSGAFVMRNLLFNASLTVPFRGDPVVVALGFATRTKPFNLSVMMFGGGGYVNLEFDHNGLRRMDIALEFGAAIAVEFVIAKGEAHVLGGIRFELRSGPTADAEKTVALVGYLRIGGSLEVLGLITVTVELVLSLGYESAGNRLVGRATLVLELDLTIWSDKVELDSGEWVISGGEPEPTERLLPDTPDGFLDLLRQHRNAFRSVPGELSDV